MVDLCTARLISRKNGRRSSLLDDLSVAWRDAMTVSTNNLWTAAILGKFRMKCRGQQISLPHEDRETFAPGQHFHIGAGLRESRRADEHHLQGTAGKGGGFGENGRVDLPAVGVALHHRVERLQAALMGMAHFARQQDRARAGSEHGPRGGKFFE